MEPLIEAYQQAVNQKTQTAAALQVAQNADNAANAAVEAAKQALMNFIIPGGNAAPVQPPAGN